MAVYVIGLQSILRWCLSKTLRAVHTQHFCLKLLLLLFISVSATFFKISINMKYKKEGFFLFAYHFSHVFYFILLIIKFMYESVDMICRMQLVFK